MKMSDVVAVAEGVGGKGMLIRLPNGGSENAADFLVCRLFTDAIFNEDIRAIQLIIDRIDGGLPKDIDMDGYRTQFSDCFNEIMQMESASQIKLLPDDTVMMALCKALYALSVQDIYWDPTRSASASRPPWSSRSATPRCAWSSSAPAAARRCPPRASSTRR